MTSGVVEKQIIFGKAKQAGEMTEEEKHLQEEIDMLINKLMDADEKSYKVVLEQLCNLIKSSTTSLACIPAPLKYLDCHYDTLKKIYLKTKHEETRKLCADIISLLAIVACRNPESLKKRECLKFCLSGTGKHIGDWGHEYIRHLEDELIEEWNSLSEKEQGFRSKNLLPLVKQIVHFNMNHSAELQACDFLMELDQLSILNDYIDINNYSRVCLYLLSCAKYEDGIENEKILQNVLSYYLQYNSYPQAMHLALQFNNLEVIKHIFDSCPDLDMQKQLAFMLAQQKLSLDINDDLPNAEDLQQIITNTTITDHFHNLARELDILEPKTPDEVYKTWLEGATLQTAFNTEKHLDSAKQNLASTFVNAFVNAGFGKDKLLTADEGKKWIYRNKESGMLSATASLGLIYLWDVEGGLTPIDCYLYSSDDYVKAGALLAIGMVNFGVRNPFEPAKALLSDYVENKNDVLRISAILGLGFAYAGTKQQDVVSLLTSALQEPSSKPAVTSLIALSLSLIMVGSGDHELTSVILQVLQDMDQTQLYHTYSRFFALALGLCFLGKRESIEATQAALDVLTEPFKGMAKTMLNMCAYAGTGDVLKVQEMLHICGGLCHEEEKAKDTDGKGMLPMEAVAVLAAAVIASNEDIGSEMCSRIFGHLGRYGELSIRRTVPLAMALCFISNPQMAALEMLNKYSHDADLDVCLSAIFAMGLIGAGTNNARLAAMLHQLALFHSKNPNHLFMVRLSQGLLHMGKGTMSLSPFHMDRQVMNPTAMAGLLVVLVAFMDAKNIILGKSHYLLYYLVLAMHPRWLVTLDERLEPLSVSVRVGQAVDVVGKAGSPKTITGMRTHNTPVLLGEGERAELVNDEYVPLSAIMEGFVILRKKFGSNK